MITSSHERIHHSNLVRLGILPLKFLDEQSAASLGLIDEVLFEFPDRYDQLQTIGKMHVIAARSGKTLEFRATVRIDTPVEPLY